MKKEAAAIKKNNAHLVPKNKLVLEAFNLEQVMIYGKPKIKRLPIRLY
jgi:hypothetical protein